MQPPLIIPPSATQASGYNPLEPRNNIRRNTPEPLRLSLPPPGSQHLVFSPAQKPPRAKSTGGGWLRRLWPGPTKQAAL